MSTLVAPVPVDTTGIHNRPGLARLVAVELRKMVDTRAGFWLQIATVAITALVVVARSVTGDAADHSFASVLTLGIQPAAVVLPIVGILLVTSEWSQRTGMITFALVPLRSRILGAKLVACLVLSLAVLAMSVALVAAGVLAVGGSWADAPTLIAQSAVFVTTGALVGFAFGAVVLASAPAIVALFALPIAWTAIATLSFLADAAPWLDTRLALAPMHEEVMTATQWAHAGTALAIWMLLPLVIGIWRITRREIAG